MNRMNEGLIKSAVKEELRINSYAWLCGDVGAYYLEIDDGYMIVHHSGIVTGVGVRVWESDNRVNMRFKIDGNLIVIRQHELMMLLWVGCKPVNKVINHMDNNGLNNSIDNLEYVTNSINVKHGSIIKRARGFGLIGCDCKLSGTKLEQSSYRSHSAGFMNKSTLIKVLSLCLV